MVRDGGMRMVGPNCMGLLNTDPAVNLNGTFAPVYPPRGNVAMSSQSGALGIALLDFAQRLDVGISSFVSVGNKADISGNDLLLHWEGDPATDVIVLYLESFGNPRRFSRIARRVGRKKPIVAVKSGRTHAGVRAAGSHTGALASSDVAAEALFRQTGVIRTNTLNGLFNVTSLLANQPVPAGPRVAIVTNAGGPGILAADAVAANGLELAEFSPELQGRLRAILSPEASVGNPVDMVASAGPDAYRRTIAEVMSSGEVDSLITIFIPTSTEGHEEVWDVIQDTAMANDEITTLAVFMSSNERRRKDDKLTLPTYTFPEGAAQALARVVRYGDWLKRQEGNLPFFEDVDSEAAATVIASAVDRFDAEGGWLEPEEVEAVLTAYGLTLPGSKVCETPEEATAFAESLGGTVALKAVGVVHKTDVGGVVLDLAPAEVAGAFTEMMESVPNITAVQVQEFIGEGHEVLIGMSEDPTFGPIIAFGMGGVYVELLKDVAFRIHPVTDLDVKDMISELKSAPLLDGYRGGPAGDKEAVEAALLRVGAMIEDHQEIMEMDLNPVKVLEPGKGLRTVDGRIRVRRMEAHYVPSRRDMTGVQ
jgi:acyl-CoA synthetase (NDP forming)